MSSTPKTVEEAKVEHVTKMGEELGELYDALWQQVAWLYQKWGEYVVLFGTKPSRVELLNLAAPKFFRIVQDILWKDVLLHIARLTDVPESLGKKPNLSFRRLPTAIAHAETRAKVEVALEKALVQSTFCRDWRNRYIAHRDLDLALSRSASPLALASREKVSKALESLTEILNVVAVHYLETTTFFESPRSAGGAENLLYVVNEGIKAREAQEERLRAGTAIPGDWKLWDL